MQTFSIIIPVYFNEVNLGDTIPQLINLGNNLEYNLELVFVDDGSGDNSLKVLLQFQESYPAKIKVVKLTRNFGSMAAIQAGLTIATGDCVGMISADLQDPPELFYEMLKHWEEGNKAVFAVRQDRDEPAIQKLFASAYYALIRKYAIPQYPSGGFDYFLIDRQVVNEINNIKEKNTNLMSLIFWLGFKPVMLPYVRRKRRNGKSRWTFSKKIKLFVDTFAAFSYFPIRLLTIVGIIVAIVSFIYGGYIFYSWLANGIEVKGYAPIMLVLIFTAGIQMTMLGVLGEYLWRTLDETRKRPFYVIDEVYLQGNEK